MKTFTKIFATSLALMGSLSHAAITHDKAYGDWKGACEGKDCGLIQVANDNQKNPIGRFIFRKLEREGKQNVVAFITVPLGVSLKGGLGVAVDMKELGRAAYDFCDEGGCTAIIEFDEKSLENVRKGSKMQVGVFILDEPQAMEFSLKGITEGLKNL
ncbi:MAG: invasion associated locus B family protein [Cardiobacteriaceae bacterium]|nr:invasion associated locus B family protein [Cardiobacteriaceae bacterium]